MAKKDPNRQKLREDYDQCLKNLLFIVDAILKSDEKNFATIKSSLQQYRDYFVESQEKFHPM